MHQQLMKGFNSVAIPSLFENPGFPAIPLEPLQREGVLKEYREIGLAGFEPTTS